MSMTGRQLKKPSTWVNRAMTLGASVRDEVDGVTYQVIGFLGRGGMGEVYQVARTDTGARFALKCLQLQHVGNVKTIERTRRACVKTGRSGW